MKRILWAILLIAISTNLPAPLFPYYQSAYQLNDLSITTLFAVYAACLLPILLISSSLAARIGLRAVSLWGLLFALCSALLFICATAAWQLFAARILEGFAVGAFMGTSNALLLQYSEKDVVHSLKYSSMCNMFGFGFGPLLCGYIIQYSPFLPHRLPYLLLFAALLSAVLLFFTLEKQPEILDKTARPKILLGVPRESHKIFWSFIAPAAFTMLALNGIIIALIPTYMKVLFHSNNSAVSGTLLFLMLSGSGIAQMSIYPASRVRRIQFGIGFLLLGTWSLIAAAPLQSMVCLLVGMVLQAVGTGWTFQGTLQLTGECSDEKSRGGSISTFFVCAYSGMAFPTVGIGLLSTLCGLMNALICLGICITFICILILYAPSYHKNFSVSPSGPQSLDL